MRYLESVDNSLRLLLYLSANARVGVSDVAERLGVAPSTAHRLLSTLRFRGFVTQAKDRTYRPGPALEQLVSMRMRRSDLADVVLPCLTELRDATDESAHFGVLVGPQMRIIASVESTQPLRVGSRSGVMLPAHLAAGGKTLLAELDPRDLDELYPPGGTDNPRLTSAAMTSLRQELRRVRRQGFGLNHEQTERGITVIGLLVVEDDEPVGAISLSMPSVRYQPRTVPELVRKMEDTRACILGRLRA